MDYPEGLYLGFTPYEVPAIFDAQDIAWVEFTDGGHGDPVRWQANIIIDTCKALGVEIAMSEEGDELTITEFLDHYLGELAFRD